jgi:hypothetical protein
MAGLRLIAQQELLVQTPAMLGAGAVSFLGELRMCSAASTVVATKASLRHVSTWSLGRVHVAYQLKAEKTMAATPQL